MSKTMRAAEIMLADGGWFTADSLGKAMGKTAREVSGHLYSIRRSPIYETEETPLPGRKIKVKAIRGRKVTTESLWKLAIFGRAAA